MSFVSDVYSSKKARMPIVVTFFEETRRGYAKGIRCVVTGLSKSPCSPVLRASATPANCRWSSFASEAIDANIKPCWEVQGRSDAACTAKLLILPNFASCGSRPSARHARSSAAGPPRWHAERHVHDRRQRSRESYASCSAPTSSAEKGFTARFSFHIPKPTSPDMVPQEP
jgi:hypothetical protein